MVTHAGQTVSLAAPIETVASPDNPEPCGHAPTGDVGDRTVTPGLHFAMDRLAMNVHGNADSHIDALCHVIYDGALYNGVDPGTVTPGAGTALSIDVARDGIVGRGVLLDIPRVRGVPWLEPGDHVTAADLEAAERAQHVRIRTGDLLFVRVGLQLLNALATPMSDAAGMVVTEMKEPDGQRGQPFPDRLPRVPV